MAKKTPKPVDDKVETIPPAPDSGDDKEEILSSVSASENEAKAKKSEKEECHDQLNAMLAEAGGLESNIGVYSPYWDLLKRYRSL